MLKILQARLQQYMNLWELPDVQTGIRKGRSIWDQIVNILWIIEKAREFQKNIYFCFIDFIKAVDFVDNNKQWKILQETGIPAPVSWETYIQVKKQQSEPDMEQTGSKSGKEYVKAVYLTYVQNTSCQMPGWMNHKLASILLGKISTTSDM